MLSKHLCYLINMPRAFYRTTGAIARKHMHTICELQFLAHVQRLHFSALEAA